MTIYQIDNIFLCVTQLSSCSMHNKFVLSYMQLLRLSRPTLTVALIGLYTATKFSVPDLFL